MVGQVDQRGQKLCCVSRNGGPLRPLLLPSSLIAAWTPVSHQPECDEGVEPLSLKAQLIQGIHGLGRVAVGNALQDTSSSKVSKGKHAKSQQTLHGT